MYVQLCLGKTLGLGTGETTQQVGVGGVEISFPLEVSMEQSSSRFWPDVTPEEGTSGRT